MDVGSKLGSKSGQNQLSPDFPANSPQDSPHFLPEQFVCLVARVQAAGSCCGKFSPLKINTILLGPLASLAHACPPPISPVFLSASAKTPSAWPIFPQRNLRQPWNPRTRRPSPNSRHAERTRNPSPLLLVGQILRQDDRKSYNKSRL